MLRKDLIKLTTDAITKGYKYVMLVTSDELDNGMVEPVGVVQRAEYVIQEFTDCEIDYIDGLVNVIPMCLDKNTEAAMLNINSVIN